MNITKLFNNILNSSLAQTSKDRLGELTPPIPSTENLGDVAVRFVNFAIGSGVAVFSLVFLWGAIQWLTSAGDKAALDKAKGTFTSGVIGLILLAVVYLIVQIVRMITIG